MLWPKINSYEEFDNEKKNSCGSKVPSPPLPPITFLIVRPLVADVWPTLQVKPGEKKTTKSSVKRKRRLAQLDRVPHCAFDCLLLLIRPNKACWVG